MATGIPFQVPDAAMVVARLQLVEAAPAARGLIAQLHTHAGDWLSRLPAMGENLAQAGQRYWGQAQSLLAALQEQTTLLQLPAASAEDGASTGWYALLGYQGGQAVFLWVFGGVTDMGLVVSMPADEAQQLAGRTSVAVQ